MSAKEPVTTAQMTDEQFSKHAVEILTRELGTEGIARFLRINQTGTGDYIRDRHKWQKEITVREIMEDIAKHREASN
jgi:hypothetical protein